MIDYTSDYDTLLNTY
jgi:hypothetical protein